MCLSGTFTLPQGQLRELGRFSSLLDPGRLLTISVHASGFETRLVRRDARTRYDVNQSGYNGSKKHGYSADGAKVLNYIFRIEEVRSFHRHDDTAGGHYITACAPSLWWPSNCLSGLTWPTTPYSAQLPRPGLYSATRPLQHRALIPSTRHSSHYRFETRLPLDSTRVSCFRLRSQCALVAMDQPNTEPGDEEAEYLRSHRHYPSLPARCSRLLFSSLTVRVSVQIARLSDRSFQCTVHRYLLQVEHLVART